jgi:hypothetical protein
MAWLAQHLGIGQSGGFAGAAPSAPGAGVFAGPPSPTGMGTGMAGVGAPSLPSGISKSQSALAQFYMGSGVDPATAWSMATMGQQSSPGAALAASAALPASAILEAKLRPELASEARQEQIHVTPPGPLPFAGAPSPDPAITTAAIIAQLL